MKMISYIMHDLPLQREGNQTPRHLEKICGPKKENMLPCRDF